jgi:hypothetical protein
MRVSILSVGVTADADYAARGRLHGSDRCDRDGVKEVASKNLRLLLVVR